MTIKRYLSGKISPKYTKSNYPSNFNELIIDKILKDEVNKDILNFILNDLLIKDWLEIFLYKKSFEDFDKYNEFNPNDFLVQKIRAIIIMNFWEIFFLVKIKKIMSILKMIKNIRNSSIFFH